MNGPTIIQAFQNDLFKAVTKRPDQKPRPRGLLIDPWFAMSLLQKSVRRGQVDWALAAATTLLERFPERFWRRLGVIAYEDIGLANFDLVAMTTVALKGKGFRRQLGGEWTVASYLVEQMCLSPKCRAADDLLFAIERHPSYEQQRLKQTFTPIKHLLKQAVSSDDICLRSLALWCAIGTDRAASDTLRVRKGDYNAAFDYMAERGFPDTVVEICRAGFRKTGEIMAAFLVFLEQASRSEEPTIINDTLPTETLINGIPCWAFDMHVREGNRSLSTLLKQDCDFARWHQAHISASKGVKVAGMLLLRIESGLVERRIHWSLADRLAADTDHCYPGLSAEDAKEGMALLKSDLPTLNEARRHVAAGSR